MSYDIKGVQGVRKMLVEFKDFAFKGNMIDLAVGVVLGAAFGTVIKSIVDNIIMPIISYVPGLRSGYEHWHLGRITIGRFLADLVSFTLIAFAVFIVIVKLVGAVMKRVQSKPEPGQPTTKECPKCLSIIPIKAIKCAHCTADLDPVVATA